VEGCHASEEPRLSGRKNIFFEINTTLTDAVIFRDHTKGWDSHKTDLKVNQHLIAKYLLSLT
jgi:hypothetical protein